MKHASRERLVALYEDLSILTARECDAACARPRSCCEARYCALAIDHARAHWRIELTETWHPVLPLMGDDGCTAAPHLRPICTAHTCAVCAHGEKPGDEAWTARYRAITEEIDEIEARLFGEARL